MKEILKAGDVVESIHPCSRIGVQKRFIVSNGEGGLIAVNKGGIAVVKGGQKSFEKCGFHKIGKLLDLGVQR
jgi:hypothetical protein